MARKQSPADRLERLKSSRYYLHDTFMSKIDIWYHPKNDIDYTIASYNRRDCDIEARQYNDGALELTEKWVYLIDGENS